MNSHIYLDESGDLGWNFNFPHRKGGSSRFLTIGFLICPDSFHKYPKRLVRDVYTKFRLNPKKERKATNITPAQNNYIALETIKMLNKYPSKHLGAITVKKERVMTHIRTDGNKLYNYMIKLGTFKEIEHHSTSKLIRDNRAVKVASGNSCIDYLQTTIWFENQSQVLISDYPTQSHQDDGIIFIDWITNIVWKHYEDGVSTSHNILADSKNQNYLNDIKLYFR